MQARYEGTCAPLYGRGNRLTKVVDRRKKRWVERKGKGSERVSRIREGAEVGLAEVTHMLQPCTSVPTYDYKKSQCPRPDRLFSVLADLRLRRGEKSRVSVA